MKNRISGYSQVVVMVLLLFLGACGVRGRPQPPLTPTELGRGKPSFKRATEDYAFPSVASPDGASKSSRPSPTPRPDVNDNPEDDEE